MEAESILIPLVDHLSTEIRKASTEVPEALRAPHILLGYHISEIAAYLLCDPPQLERQ
jgi:hypothetical protein